MVESPWAVLVVPVGVLPELLFSSISISFAAIARAMSHFAYFFTLVINPMFWFGGAFFPFDELPRWVQIVAFFVPLKQVVDIYRGLINGELEWSMLGSLAWLAVVTVGFYTVAIALMRRRLIQ